MKTFFKWISENIVDTGGPTHQIGVQSGRGEGKLGAGFQTFKEKRPFGTIIGDYVRKFLLNFNPRKENERWVKDIIGNVYKLYQYPHNVDELLGNETERILGGEDLSKNKAGSNRSGQEIIDIFKKISSLDKNSSRESYMILFPALLKIQHFPYMDEKVGNLMFLIQEIIDQIIILYHQEFFLSNKDSIETALENIVYDFDLPKDFIEMIKDGLNKFEFRNSPDLYYINVNEAFFNFEALNTGNVSLQGVEDTLGDFLFLLKKIAEGTILTNTIKGMLHQLSYKEG